MIKPKEKFIFKKLELLHHNEQYALLYFVLNSYVKIVTYSETVFIIYYETLYISQLIS